VARYIDIALPAAPSGTATSAPSDDDAVDDEGPLPGTSSSDVSLALPAARRRDFEEGLLLKRPALKSLRITKTMLPHRSWRRQALTSPFSHQIV
jgi:hypothetical protein